MKYLIYISILFFILFSITPSFAVNTTSTIGEQVDVNSHEVPGVTMIDNITLKEKNDKTWFQKKWDNLVKKHVPKKNKKAKNKKSKNGALNLTTKLSYWWFGTAVGSLLLFVVGHSIPLLYFTEFAKIIGLLLRSLSVILYLAAILLFWIWYFRRWKGI